MPTISPAQSSPGEEITAAKINNPINTIANAINGNLDADNLADNAVSSAKIAGNAVTTAKIADDAVTPNKMDFGAATASVSNSGTTTSTSYTATLSGSPGTNPSVTVTVPASGCVLVSIGAVHANSTNSATSRVSFALSGANTLAGDGHQAELVNQQPTGQNGISRGHGQTIMLTGLTAGSTTFAMQYRVTSGTGTFSNRHISVIPIGD